MRGSTSPVTLLQTGGVVLVVGRALDRLASERVSDCFRTWRMRFDFPTYGSSLPIYNRHLRAHCFLRCTDGKDIFCLLVLHTIDWSTRVALSICADEYHNAITLNPKASADVTTL